MYVRALLDLNEKQLAYGFEQALKLFKPEFGKTFPYPGEIKDWACQWRPEFETTKATKALLDRGDKPPDWEPMTKKQAADFIADLKRKAQTEKWLSK